MASQREPWPPAAGAVTAEPDDLPGRHYRRLAAQVERPTLMLRVRVLATRRSLDEQLACGASPARTDALAVRARQLVSRRTRQQVAAGLERLVREAERPVPLHPAALSLPRRQIVELRAALLGIAACLREARPVYAHGMAVLWRLLTDGAGPVYDPHATHSLRRGVPVAAEALDGRWPGRSSAWPPEASS
jgi:hypothetical protein